MDEQIDQIISALTKNPGATEDSINSLNELSNNRLPVSYLQLMAATNGLEGFVGEEAYLMLWPAEKIHELNESYAVDEFAPGLLLFGSNGGDMAYAFDTNSEEMPFVEVPFIGMALDQRRIIGKTLKEFFEHLRKAK